MVWNVAGENSLVDLIRRFVLMLMIGNGDMHLKNWSFIYRDGRVATLAPAYDFLSTIPYIPEDGLALNFAGSKKMQEISYAHFKALANKAKLPENLVLQTVKATALEIKSAWNSQKKHAEIPAVIKKCIDLHMKSSALFSP
jgi:serine/threonine-protein kinase HipA